MKSYLLLLPFAFIYTLACSQNNTNSASMKSETKAVTCKLTTPELQERKKTVIADLKKLVLERQDTSKGIKYKFESSDDLLDLVASFIKTERLCCDFFDFTLAIEAETGFMWLELSGPPGTKDFIREEIGL